jgi:hypothetical protein
MAQSARSPALRKRADLAETLRLRAEEAHLAAFL